MKWAWVDLTAETSSFLIIGKKSQAFLINMLSSKEIPCIFFCLVSVTVTPEVHRRSLVMAYLVGISISWKKENNIISDLLGKSENFKGRQ